jgi:hypothetical protein
VASKRLCWLVSSSSGMVQYSNTVERKRLDVVGAVVVVVVMTGLFDSVIDLHFEVGFVSTAT